MIDAPVLRDLGVVIVGAALLLFMGRKVGIPPILAYIATGLALGPATGILDPDGSVDLFAELGITLLLFVVGLEMSLARVREIGRAAAVTGTVQVAATFALGAGLGAALGVSLPAALMVGLVAAFSSTVVVVKLLDRTGALGSLQGRLAVGILLVQDVLVALILTVVSGVAEGGGEGVVASLVRALLAISGLAAVGAAAGRWVLPRFFRWLSPAPEGLFIVALTWVFGFILAAEALHVSIELGAFIAGVVLAQMELSDELRRRTHPLVDFFLAVFFVALGARMEPSAMAATWRPALAVSVFVLVAKPLLVAVVLGSQGQPRAVAVRTGVTLGQTSEFGFLLAAIAVSAGWVDPSFAGFVGMVGLLTIGASAALVPRADAVVRRLERFGLLARLPGTTSEEASPQPASGHVIVVGMNTLGLLLVDRFAALEEDVLAVDTDPRKLEGLSVRTLQGNVLAPAVAEEAGLRHARLVVSTLRIEDVNSMLAHRCAELRVPVSVHAFDPSLAEELWEVGADHLMLSKLDGIRQVEEALARLGVLA